MEGSERFGANPPKVSKHILDKFFVVKMLSHLWPGCVIIFLGGRS